VRDAQGLKMSKMLGNVLDPIELVEEYGADALRFTLASLDSPGRDVPLNRDQIAGYRAFGNKIWNAARFALGRVGAAQVQPDLDPQGLEAPERWILSRLSRVAAEVGERLAAFRFDEACNRLYHFFWGDLCDWYIELAKPALSGEAPRPRAGEVLMTVLDRSLRLLHPIMPFLTEEVWQRLPGHQAIHPETICLAPYPQRDERWESAEVEAGMDVLMQVVTRVRSLRAELGLQPKAPADLHLVPTAGADPASVELLAAQRHLIGSLCRVEVSALGAGQPPAGAVRDLVAGFEVAVTLRPRAASAGAAAAGGDGGPGDGRRSGEGGERAQAGAADRERLRRELARLEAEIARAEQRLGNADFLAKAPAAVVEGGRARLAELREREERIRASLGAAAREPAAAGHSEAGG
jgi:valyl-tRNA synthetase